MTDQGKNEVLAKWAGFTYLCQAGFRKEFAMWEPPTGGMIELPDLLHSLDAQAKWLWPKLTRLQLFKMVTFWLYPEDGVERNPAEACAEAILILIGTEA